MYLYHVATSVRFIVKIEVYSRYKYRYRCRYRLAVETIFYARAQPNFTVFTTLQVHDTGGL